MAREKRERREKKKIHCRGFARIENGSEETRKNGIQKSESSPKPMEFGCLTGFNSQLLALVEGDRVRGESDLL
ncbi:MAG: hypothetical protein HKN33_07705 [Pyrinomonadaceae bacterium]|nr:hypothetical protein [Pyrinomonadaceae bacterium]